MRKPMKTTEYRKMPAVRGFYGFKRKTLWRRYRFSFPFFFFFFLFFILFIAHAARGRIGKYNKTWSVFFVTFTSENRVNRKRNNICHSRWCKLRKKKDVLTIKNCSRSNTLYVIIEILFIFFLFFSEFRIKIRLREEISAMLWLFN